MTGPPAPIVWRPSEEQVERSQLTRFARSLGRDVHPYESLHRWSVADLDGFWAAVWEHTEVIGTRRGPVLTTVDDRRMSGARFFPQAELNLAENLLRGPAGRTAVVSGDESGHLSRMTMGELRAEVARTEHALLELGVEPGDRVAGILPNTLDAVVALLATTALGAIWTSCSPDFGATAIHDRLGQVGPKVVVAQTSYVYDGRAHDVRERLATVLERLPSVDHLVLAGEGTVGDVPARIEVHHLDRLKRGRSTEPVFARLPFDHPVYILYTSGTTGKPKCITHGAGGALLTHLKEHVLHGDVGADDVMLYYTSTAWMMYHWQLSALAAGATIVIYDGSPLPRTADGRDHGVLWDLAERTGTTHLGASPGYLRALQSAGYAPGRHHDLGQLRTLMSAGAPLVAEQYHWVHRDVREDICLASISGGTEILGCFVMGNPTLPVRAGEIQGPALGMAVAAVDERGIPVVGRSGDLVCTEPFPSMPLRFWGEGGLERYRAAYLEQRPEVWTHGDLAEVRASGGVVIHGRTDTTLNPGGVRIGTAEIYRVVDGLDQVQDSLVVGRPVGDDEEMWLFVALRDGVELDERTETTIRAALRAEASPRHVPKRVLEVGDIPYTHNGKKVEKAVLDLLQGREVDNRASLRNPASLDGFARYASPARV